MKRIVLMVLWACISFICVAQYYQNLIYPDLYEDNCSESEPSSSLLPQFESWELANTISKQELGMMFLPSDSDGVIPIRINLFFIQQNDGMGSFLHNSTEHQLFLDDCINDLNQRYSNNIYFEDNIPQKDNVFIPDLKIRFLDARYYIRNDSIWAKGNGALCPDNNIHLKSLDSTILRDTSIQRGVNIYFTEDSAVYNRYWRQQNSDTITFSGMGNACSQFPTQTDYNRTSMLHILDFASKYWWMKNVVPNMSSYNYAIWDPVVRTWALNTLGSSLAHELGHTLSLTHDSSYYHLVMNPSGRSARNSFRTSEIAMIYATMMCTNVRSFIPANTYVGIKRITQSGSFPEMRLYHGLVVDTSASIVLSKNTILPPQAQIIVYGDMAIISGTLHSAMQHWKGITVKQGGTLRLSNVSIADFNICVEDGGTLFVEDSLCITNSHYIEIFSGGHLCVANQSRIHLEDSHSQIRLWGDLNETICNNAVDPDWIITGDGQFVNFNENKYLQNVSVSDSLYVGGNTIYIGENVTDLVDYGEVNLLPGSCIQIEAKEVSFLSGITVERGASLNVDIVTR